MNERSYSEIELHGDEDLEWLIEFDLNCKAAECVFIPLRVALPELAHATTSPLEDYLIDGSEGAYERALEFAEIYSESGPDALPPIVFWRGAERLHLLDGYKRLAGASAAGLTELPAYEARRR